MSVAQSVEHLIVDQVVASSSLVTHPLMFFNKFFFQIFIIILIFLRFFSFFPLWSLERYIPVVLEKIKRNPNNFTQGIKIYQEYLFESAGLYGESKLYRYPLKEKGKNKSSLFEYPLLSTRFIFPDDVFAEDIEIINDLIYVLTWKEETLYVLNKDLEVVDTKIYMGEGWGIAFDGDHFITSDGSSRLIYRDLESFKEYKRVEIIHRERKLNQINALEYVLGNIYANVWFDNRIYIISPDSGLVIGIIDCEALVRDHHRESIAIISRNNFTFSQQKENVLNGIAYDKKDGVFYLTGKRWLYFYKVLFRKINDITE